MLMVVVEQYLHMNGMDQTDILASTNVNYVNNLNLSGYSVVVTDNLGCTDTAIQL